MKLFSVLILILLLAGCSALCPQLKQAVLQDQHSFSQAFDAFQTSNKVDQLQKFKADYPDSRWASRAETIILYSQELDQRKEQIEKLRDSQQQQILELEQLKKVNLQLTEQIKQLKNLLIQLETHPQ